MSKRFFLLILTAFFFLTECKPLDLDNACDTKSPNYFRNLILVQILKIRNAGCYPGWTSRPSLWGFFSINVGNALVRDIVINDNKAYVGGMFDYIAPNTGSLVMLNDRDQKLLPEFSCPYFEIDGTVNQILGDGNGNAIVVGTFSHVFGVKRKAIAKIKSDCTLDSSFNVNLADSSAEIRTAVIHNGKLFIGGQFTGTFSTTSSETRSNLALVDLATGALDTSWSTGVTGEVNMLVSDGTFLFIAGNFSEVGTTPVSHLARVDLATGSSISTLGEPDGAVQVIVLDGPEMYVGGNFNTIDSTLTNFVAKINYGGSLQWANSSLDSAVQSLFLSNNKLYVGGGFSSPRPGLIALNPATGLDLGIDFRLNTGNVSAIRQVDNNLFLFGSFTSILDTPISYLAKLDPTNDTVLNWDAKIGGPNSSERGGIFKFPNGNLLVGGSFPALQGKARTFLAEIDLSTGEPTDWSPTFNQPGGVEVIRAMHLFQNRLYITGSFTAVNSTPRTRFAAFDISPSAKPVLSDVNISLTGYTQVMTKITDYKNQIYVAGGFANVNATPHNHIVSINPATNQPSFTFNPNTNFGINDLIPLSNGKLIIAGDFTTINGGSTINRFAAVNETNGNLIQSPGGPNIGLVSRAVEYNGNLIVSFQNAAAPTGSGCCLGIYDIDSLQPISRDYGILPLAGGNVTNIFLTNKEMFLVGSFTNVLSEKRDNFASISLEDNKLTNFAPVFNADIYSVKENSTDFYIMGRFTSVDGRKRNSLVRLRKSDRSIIE